MKKFNAVLTGVYGFCAFMTGIIISKDTFMGLVSAVATIIIYTMLDEMQYEKV